ncbi:MAG: CHAT domain-containing protein [Planctomycetes bacterium]|nr:CHAT domain-containing protein [Planctomycetota bacterium]
MPSPLPSLLAALLAVPVFLPLPGRLPHSGRLPRIRPQAPPPAAAGDPSDPSDLGEEERSVLARFEALLGEGRAKEAQGALQPLLESRAHPGTRLAILERAADACDRAGQAILAADYFAGALDVCRTASLEAPYRRLHPRYLERVHALGWDFKVAEAAVESPGDPAEGRPARGAGSLTRILADAYLAADLNDAAVSAFEGLVAETSSLDDRVAQAVATCGLAESLLSVGRYGEAWVRVAEAERKGEGAPAARGRVARGRGRLLLYAGLPGKALEFLLAAEGAHVEAGNREAAALDLSLAAQAAGRLGRQQEALALARRALGHASGGKDPRVRDASALAYARALLGCGALPEAAEVLQSVVQETGSGRRTAGLGTADLVQGDLELARGNLDAAERAAAEAASTWRDGSLPFRQTLAVAAALPLRARLGRKGPAMEFHAGLVANLLHMRLPWCPEDFRIEIGRRIREAVPSVPGLFAPASRTGNVALDFDEPVLAADHLRSFRDALDLRRFERPPADRPGLPPFSRKSAEDGLARLRGELQRAEASAPAGRGMAPDLRGRVALAEEELRLIRGRDRSLARFLAQFRRVTSAEARGARERTLGARGAYLGYFLGESGSFLALLTAEAQERLPLPPRGEIEAAVRAYLPLLHGGDPGAAAAARSLSSLLLGPALPSLSGKRELWISADGILHALPFDLLPISDGTGASEEPAGLGRSIACIPSFHFLLPETGEPIEGPKETTDLLVVTGGGFGATRERVAAAEFALGAGRVPGEAAAEDGSGCRELALRGARAFCSPEELPRVEGLLRGDGTLRLPRVHARAGKEATEDALWGDRTAYRVVLYALPWAPGANARWLAGFSCSPDAGLGRSGEGFLSAFEVRQALYRAELVLLPTTRAPIEESPFPLFARSFLAAGAKRLLFRLFPGSDDPAFLGDLSAALARTPDRPVEALRAAREAARARSGDPRAWAGFVLYGDPR